MFMEEERSVCVCPHVYVHIRVYMCVHMCVCVHTLVYVCVHLCVCLCISVYVCMCTHTCICVYVFVYLCVCVHIRVYVCVCTSMYMCLCMYVYTFLCTCVCVCVCTHARVCMTCWFFPCRLSKKWALFLAICIPSGTALPRRRFQVIWDEACTVVHSVGTVGCSSVAAPKALHPFCAIEGSDHFTF